MLEGVVATPQEVSGSVPGVVVCHPHPLFGGDMNNGVVLSVCQALVREGIAALRFNFRGVGNSDGSFSKGEEEKEDVSAALDVLRAWPGVDKSRLGLAGYSFGASMVLAGISRYKAAKALALISPPVAAVSDPAIGKDKRPKLFIIGDKDSLVPHGALKEKVESYQRSPEVLLVPGADHSWRGHEEEMSQHVVTFLVEVLNR